MKDFMTKQQYDKDTYPQTVEQVDYFVNKHNLTLHVTNEPSLPSWFCQKLEKY